MKNKGIKILGGFLVILIATFIVLNFTLDGIIKSEIEETSSELLQTEVDVGNVNVSIFNGSGEIYGFVVQNPDNFSNEPAINIGQVNIQIDLASIFSDTIIVENIHILNPEFFFEQKGFGANLKTLNDNMDLAEEPEAKSLIIEHLLVENGTVRVSSTIERERTAEASIEQFELNDIGRSGSNTTKESIRQIMKPLLQRAIRKAVNGGLLEQLENKVQDLLSGNDEQ